jgi:hypothetical protein
MAPSGQDSLQVRQAYFQERRSTHIGDLRLTPFWVILGAIVSWMFIAGFTGFVH